MKEHGPLTTRLLNVKAIFETVLNSEKARNRSKLSLVIYQSFLAILYLLHRSFIFAQYMVMSQRTEAVITRSGTETQ